MDWEARLPMAGVVRTTATATALLLALMSRLHACVDNFICSSVSVGVMVNVEYLKVAVTDPGMNLPVVSLT